jgi:hypothetical protein
MCLQTKALINIAPSITWAAVQTVGPALQQGSCHAQYGPASFLIRHHKEWWCLDIADVVQHILLLPAAACLPLSWLESIIGLPMQCSTTNAQACCTAANLKKWPKHMDVKRWPTLIDKLFE